MIPPAPRASLAAWARAALVALPVGGCQLVFDGELGTVRCVEEGAYGLPACPAGQSCVAGTCVEVGAPLGEPCARSEDCAAGSFCLDPASLGEPGQSWCSAPCCSSTQCGPAQRGQVCRALAGDAGRLCWPAARLGRSALGEGAAGRACGADAACRSGVCLGGACQDVCCDDRFCAEGGLVCGAGPGWDGDRTWTCAAPSPGLEVPPTCTADEQCPSGACLLDLPGGAQCAEPCCSSPGCGEALVDGRLVPRTCVASSGGALRSCSGPNPLAGRGAVGAPCGVDGDCRSGWCTTADPAYCTDACCRDQDCGDTSRFACRPVVEAAGWSLQCVRK